MASAIMDELVEKEFTLKIMCPPEWNDQEHATVLEEVIRDELDTRLSTWRVPEKLVIVVPK